MFLKYCGDYLKNPVVYKNDFKIATHKSKHPKTKYAEYRFYLLLLLLLLKRAFDIKQFERCIFIAYLQI
jgi:hypothetical protein